ncbi:MAG: SET domain-containing protein [Betaproteobacteria bacterium]
MTAEKNLAVHPVRNGLGIVALKAFAPGVTVCRVRGRVVTAEVVWQYWDNDPRRGENCFRYDADHYLDPEGEIGAYANHSCNPNAGIVKTGRRLLLQAIRPIAVGDEVTHDYSTLLGADDVWKMRCNCGEPGCRKMVRSFSKLPAVTLRRYRRLGIIPDFIRQTG